MCANYIDIGNNIFVKPVLDESTYIESVEIKTTRSMCFVFKYKDHKLLNKVVIKYITTSPGNVIPMRLDFYSPQLCPKKVAQIYQWNGREIGLRFDGQSHITLKTIDEIGNLCLKIKPN